MATVARGLGYSSSSDGCTCRCFSRYAFRSLSDTMNSSLKFPCPRSSSESSSSSESVSGIARAAQLHALRIV